MPEVLAKMLSSRFPRNGDGEQVTFNKGKIRIKIKGQLFDEVQSPLISLQEASAIAQARFRGEQLESKQDLKEGLCLIFLEQPHDNYTCHQILIHPAFYFPDITIRQRREKIIGLHPRQRHEYFGFVVDVYEHFRANA